MDVLSAVALMAVLLVAVTVLWFPPSWLRPFADKLPRREPGDDEFPRQPAGDDEFARPLRSSEAAGGAPGETVETVEWGLFTWPFVRRRLDALMEELERLETDPDVFAKAFHTMAARSAYEALLADASRLSDRPRPPGERPLSDQNRRYAGRIDVELVGPSTGRREELEF